MVQLQLSATVAIRCQFGSAARGGAVATSAMIAAARLMRIMGHSVVPSLPACQSKSAVEHGYAGLAIVGRPRPERDPQEILVMWTHPHEPLIPIPPELHRSGRP